jgi:hypothetical protein
MAWCLDHLSNKPYKAVEAPNQKGRDRGWKVLCECKGYDYSVVFALCVNFWWCPHHAPSKKLQNSDSDYN